MGDGGSEIRRGYSVKEFEVRKGVKEEVGEGEEHF